MAGKFTLLCFLWLVVACLAAEPDSGDSDTPTVTAPAATATTTITTAVPGDSSTKTVPSPATVPGDSSTEPVPSSTTVPGDSSTKTVPSSTTETDSDNSTTARPSATTPDSVTSSTMSVPSSTTAPGPCDMSPCSQGSTCEVRADKAFVCLCLAGENYNYSDKTCENAKVFPGQLSLPGLTFTDDMREKESPKFKEVSKLINSEMSATFPASGYSNSTVLKLEPAEQSRIGARSASGVIVSLEILFNTNSNIKTTEVEDMIAERASTCDECLLKNAAFNETGLCERNPCDDRTTVCLAENGSFNCTCTENYIKTDFCSRICLACPSGTQAEDSITCVSCPFGYSGFNCNESWQLVLVIVGSVLGGLLLITLILLPVLACKSSKSSKKDKTSDIGKPYVSHSPAKAPLVSGKSSVANSVAPSLNGSAFGSAGMPRIPRATTDNSDRTSLEMGPNSSRQNLIPVGRNTRLYDNQDDGNPYVQSRPQSSLYEVQPQNNPYAQSRPQNNPYAQSRPQNNPYAQSRPQNNPYDQSRPQNNPYAQSRLQNNPYAQGQGQTNPYYVHDDGRRFN